MCKRRFWINFVQRQIGCLIRFMSDYTRGYNFARDWQFAAQQFELRLSYRFDFRAVRFGFAQAVKLLQNAESASLPGLN